MIVTLITLAVFLDGLLAGMFLCSAMVEQAMATTDAAVWIAYKHAKEVVFARVMPPFMVGGIGVSGVAAILSPAHLAFAVATGLLIAAMGITVGVHLPLNKQFLTWSSTDFPPTWVDARRRWRRWNGYRTALVVIAFGVVLLGQRL